MRTTTILGIIMAAFIIIAATGFILEDSLAKPSLDQAFEYYVQAQPHIQERQSYGDKNAPITITLYSDTTSQSTADFITGILPVLETEYIATGKVRIYHKHYLTEEDYKTRSDLYAQALALECASKQTNYYTFFFAMHNTTLSKLIEKLDAKEFYACINGNEPPELFADMLEVENFGMVGINPRIYIGLDGKDTTIIDGIPSYERLKIILRRYQVKIGD